MRSVRSFQANLSSPRSPPANRTPIKSASRRGSSSEVPAELQRIVSKALRKDREERYQTLKDLLIDLKVLKDELSFAQKLQRSRPPSSSAELPIKHDATDATDARTTIQTTLVAATAEPSVLKPVSCDRRFVRVAVVGVVALVLAGFVIGVTVLWKR